MIHILGFYGRCVASNWSWRRLLEVPVAIRQYLTLGERNEGNEEICE
jgi:hypothetical protein